MAFGSPDDNRFVEQLGTCAVRIELGSFAQGVVSKQRRIGSLSAQVDKAAYDLLCKHTAACRVVRDKRIFFWVV